MRVRARDYLVFTFFFEFRSVRVGLTLLVTLIQIVKLILAHKILVVPMLYVKIRVRVFLIYCMCSIITGGLYIFYYIFEVHFFLFKKGFFQKILSL